ncbi:MAG: guanine deaminase [Nitratireductor sp.]|nr:guanine deaminase [Nitratireductor sp.]
MKRITGQLLHYSDDPHSQGGAAIHHVEAGAIVIGEDGRIAWSGEAARLPRQYHTLESVDYGDKLILPGFIDAHLHFPQYRMLAAYGKDLLDWLNRYTFIEEQRYGDPAIAAPAASAFLDELLRNGITSCLAFSTIHPSALDCLFEEAGRRNMAIASGKTLMDCNAPDGLLDSAQSAYDDSTALIGKWHGRKRLRYAISPRFAVTSSEAQLQAAGTLARENPGLLIQTHLSENKSEIEFVASRFAWSKDYTDVYDRYGLLTETALFAHGIHLSGRELARLSEAGSAVVHCPTSNNFLGSGLFRLRHTTTGSAPVRVGVGCDIGGGMSYSMFDTLRDAYTVSQLVGSRISAHEAFYRATLGNARLLGFDADAGTLEAGKYADLTVLDPAATPLMAERHALSNDLHDILFALMILGDDRAVTETYVAGAPLKPQT